MDRAEQYAVFRPAWQGFVVWIVGALLFIIGPQVSVQSKISPALSNLIASLFLAFVIVKRYSCLYRVTAQLVVAEVSFPTKRRSQAVISEIRRIDLRRGLVQRLAGVAHVWLYVQGQDEPAVKLFGVPRPEELRRLLLDLGASHQVVTGVFRS